MAEEPLVLFFEEIGNGQIGLVGGKNSSLGEMTAGGLAVPPGFAVTTRAYKDFLEFNELERKIAELLVPLKKDNIEQIEKAAESIKKLFIKNPLPKEIEKAIGDGYEKLCERIGDPQTPVAVRSSATAEDMPDASFAGQQATYLYVRTRKEVVEKVIECWASLYSSTAIAYRLGMGYAHEKVFLSVGVQKMVNAYAAGVAFTLNPLTGDPSTVVINSNFGVGESVVGGEVTPDEFYVNKITYEIFHRVIGPKEIYYVADFERRGLEKKQQAPEMQKKQSITDEEIIDLTKLAKRVERHYGRPMDIEWAMEKRGEKGSGSKEFEFFVLQARPETVISQKMTDNREKKEVDVLNMIIKRLKKGKRVEF